VRIKKRREMMRKALFVFIFALLLATATSVFAQQDSKGCKDHPLFTRMPGHWIYDCQQIQFDAHTFDVGLGKTSEVEGQVWKIAYYPKNDLTSRPSELQIIRNFENAIQKLGGTVVFSKKGKSTLKLTRDGKETWIEVRTEFTGKHWLFILQKEAMAQDVVTNAAAFGNDLRSTGHAAVYGITFDTDSAVIKAASSQAIGEIAKLLKADSGLKIFVVGHTDNTGSVDHNIKLSQDRAQSVMQALMHDHGIAAARLRSFGNGPFAPVASNDTEDGKARNRRVELVKQ
jgi:outer membrane protein OmpA-like peptidoglycan-associated protein